MLVKCFFAVWRTLEVSEDVNYAECDDGGVCSIIVIVKCALEQNRDSKIIGVFLALWEYIGKLEQLVWNWMV